MNDTYLEALSARDLGGGLDAVGPAIATGEESEDINVCDGGDAMLVSKSPNAVPNGLQYPNVSN